MINHKTFNSALCEALSFIGRGVDPDRLRERARETGRHIPGVRSSNLIQAGNPTGATGWEVDRERLHALQRLVDDLIKPQSLKVRPVLKGAA